MFHPSEIVAEAFIDHLVARHSRHYPGDPAHGHALAEAARAALTQVNRSNALYHDLSHTILVTQVGQAMLIGKEVRDGSFTSYDWLQHSVALLCFAVGFVRGAVHGDERHRVVIDEQGNTFEIPTGATDGCLWEHYTERSVMFVRRRFAEDPHIDAKFVADTIAKGRFPPQPEIPCEPGSSADLLRAAHIIGTAADPHFFHKMRRLLIEMRESGLEPGDGLEDVARFRLEYPGLFWNKFHPILLEGSALMSQTAEGRFWLAQMHAHVHAEEHRHWPATSQD